MPAERGTATYAPGASESDCGSLIRSNTLVNSLDRGELVEHATPKKEQAGEE